MNNVKLVRDSYISASYGSFEFRIGVHVKDIGCTIGTELTWWHSGERIATYRPGTRYGDYAEDLAASLVERALQNVSPGLSALGLGVALEESIKTLVSKEQPWDPDFVDEEAW